MKRIQFTLCLWVCLCVRPCLSCAQLLEVPMSKHRLDEHIVYHLGYTVSYNSTLLIPNWVAYQITADEAKGNVPRSGSFCLDPQLDEDTAFPSDYTSSGWDRGHMAPAGDMKWDEDAMKESFYMSNICPQSKELNGGAWRVLEEAIRKWAIRDGAIWVVCGPIVDSNCVTIGENKVTVPKAFWKVICKQKDDAYCSIGFLFPNEDCKGSIYDYSCSVDNIEEKIRYDFFHLLPDYLEEPMESTFNAKDWNN